MRLLPVFRLNSGKMKPKAIGLAASFFFQDRDMKALVTGGTGFLGANLAQGLLEQGW